MEGRHSGTWSKGLCGKGESGREEKRFQETGGNMTSKGICSQWHQKQQDSQGDGDGGVRGCER